ncbi:hypothetical protein E2C01_036084 [Portunus trituberculatus]|uniref:Uncharacterized protein n=1 Tax=Portunus trituberculatus TaxID=210409 RepID=A0A5B7F7R2_PORTR|nr:hypothetical protein [Portunus trituberculatus]
MDICDSLPPSGQREDCGVHGFWTVKRVFANAAILVHRWLLSRHRLGQRKFSWRFSAGKLMGIICREPRVRRAGRGAQCSQRCLGTLPACSSHHRPRSGAFVWLAHLRGPAGLHSGKASTHPRFSPSIAATCAGSSTGPGFCFCRKQYTQKLQEWRICGPGGRQEWLSQPESSQRRDSQVSATYLEELRYSRCSLVTAAGLWHHMHVAVGLRGCGAGRRVKRVGRGR